MSESDWRERVVDAVIVVLFTCIAAAGIAGVFALWKAVV